MTGMTSNVPGGKCPACGAPEVDASHPRTFYACGSSDYDQRPGTFRQGGLCVRHESIYLAGPLFTTPERIWNEELASKLNSFGYDVFLPQAECLNVEGDAQAVFDKCIDGIDTSDIVLACVDGTDADSGTAFEIGYAYAKGKPVVVYRTDFRNRADDGGVNLMLSKSCAHFIHCSSVEDTVEQLLRFLQMQRRTVRQSQEG